MSARPRWTDLPPDVLAVVSGRLHDPAEYVRFHAICRPWRESLTARRPTLFPWLVAPPSTPSRGSSELDMKLKLRCVFSKTSYLAEAPARHNWVARADGTAAWFSAFSQPPTLVDAFTGDVTALPPLVGDDGKIERRMENSRGVVYGDGTVFLYKFFYNSKFTHWALDDRGEETEEEVGFVSMSCRAAILRPGDTAWNFVDVPFEIDINDQFQGNNFLAAYRVYDGKTLVRVERSDYSDGSYFLPPPPPPPVGDHASVQSKDNCKMTRKIAEGDVFTTGSYILESSHFLESRGELLRVSVLTRGYARQRAPYEVTVHALEEEVDADGSHTVRWVRRDGRSFADRVMFLGFPTSFAVEASRFRGEVDDVSGGWVFFLLRRLDSEISGQSLHCVFRYSLIDEKAKFMARLPPELELNKYRNYDEAFMWLMPQPVIAPIQVIRERLESPNTGDPTLKVSIFRTEKPKYSKEPSISFNVRNLPPGVDSSRLRHFFNKHGKVSNVEVTSEGKWCVTMTMAALYKPYEVEDALDELVLDGNILKVCEATMATEELSVASSSGALATS